jgi:hypothetical protein
MPDPSIDPVQELIITNHGFHLQTSKVGLVITALINIRMLDVE